MAEQHVDRGLVASLQAWRRGDELYAALDRPSAPRDWATLVHHIGGFELAQILTRTPDEPMHTFSPEAVDLIRGESDLRRTTLAPAYPEFTFRQYYGTDAVLAGTLKDYLFRQGREDAEPSQAALEWLYGDTAFDSVGRVITVTPESMGHEIQALTGEGETVRLGPLGPVSLGACMELGVLVLRDIPTSGQLSE